MKKCVDCNVAIHIKSIRCRSCAAVITSTKHGEAKTRLYKTWHGMLRRCGYTKGKAHEKYKHLKVYELWKNFSQFKKWALVNGYTDDLTIDRIDNKIGYTPINCRFATCKTQAMNRKYTLTTKYTEEEIDDMMEMLSLGAIPRRVLARLVGVSAKTLYNWERKTHKDV